jgi:hypothetical protein
MSQLTDTEWNRVDSFLSESRVLAAVVLYCELTGSSLIEAKDAIGERFRTAFPDLFSTYRDVEDD